MITSRRMERRPSIGVICDNFLQFFVFKSKSKSKSIFEKSKSIQIYNSFESMFLIIILIGI